ncbi:MAG: hypothetical protein WB586_09840 [Chthoniobacterales bacterium]
MKESSSSSSSGFGFHFCRQSFDGYDLYGFSFFHERIAGRTPNIRPPQKLFRHPHRSGKARSRFFHHRFFADLNRQTLRTESFTHDKREERLNLVGHPPD